MSGRLRKRVYLGISTDPMVMDFQPTEEELGVLKDNHFLKVKQDVSEKVIAYLAHIERELHQLISQTDFPFPNQAFLRTGKISKGENYRSLPYFILDYPRMFSKTDVFSFRTMLWWGNEFSCTLHLAGSPLDRVRNVLTRRLKDEPDLYFCVHTDPWEYHFGKDNYQQVSTMDEKTIEKHIESGHFIKISDKISLDNWNEYANFTLESLKKFLKIIR